MISRPWMLPLVVAGGGLLSGLLVFLLAPEAEGHGTDAASRRSTTKAGPSYRARGPDLLFEIEYAAVFPHAGRGRA